MIVLSAQKTALLDPKCCGKLDSRAKIYPLKIKLTDLAALRVTRAVYEIFKDITNGTARQTSTGTSYVELGNDGTLRYTV